MGEVNRPGQVGMGSTRLTLTDVITQVGGIKESSADAAGVFVIRPAATSGTGSRTCTSSISGTL